MRYKKTWFNYILWGLYGLLICVCLTAQITMGCTLLRLPGVFYFMSTAAAALLLGLAVFLPARHLAEKLFGKLKRKNTAWGTMDWISMALIAALALAARFLSLRGFALENISEAVSFQRAAEAAGTGFGITAWNAEGIYTWLLTVLFSFLGTKEMVVAVFQIFLQASGVFLLYAALRFLASRLVAVIVCLIFSVWPVFINSCGEASVQSLLILLEGLTLFLTAGLLRYLKRNGQGSAAVNGAPSKKITEGVLLAVTGAALGAVGYWSLYLINVMILGSVALLYMEQRGKAGRTGKGERAAFQAAILISGSLGGFGCMLILEHFCFDAGAGELLSRWIFLNVPGQTSLWESFASADSLYFCLPLLGIAFFYLLGFFDQRGNLGMIWILPLLFLSGCALLRDESIYQPLNMLLWAVMAGMGIHSVCCFGVQAQEELPEEPERTEKKKKTVKNVMVLKPKSVKVQEPDGEEELQHVILPGQPLDNPLPVPKKHVKKDLDYAFEPEDSDMFFEIDDLGEDADFDLMD